jgi:hypothetical protein
MVLRQQKNYGDRFQDLEKLSFKMKPGSTMENPIKQDLSGQSQKVDWVCLKSNPHTTGSESFFQHAPTHNVDISTTGGDAKTSFYLGGNYFNQESIVKPDAFSRYSLRVNLDHQLREAAKIGISIDAVKTSRIKSPNNNVPYGAVNGALYTPSYLPLFNADGSYARTFSF